MYRKLFPTFDSETIILTANHRLASHFKNAYNYFQMEKGKQAWLSANVIPLDLWLMQTWMDNCNNDFRLLTEFEEKQIWQKILGYDSSQYPLLDIAASAQLAQEALEFLTLWDRQLNEIKGEYGVDVSCFYHWAKTFKNYCQTHSYIIKTELPQALMDLYQSKNNLNIKKKLILIGFDEIPPLYQRLFNTLGNTHSIDFFESETRSPQVKRLEFDEPLKEIQSMALWAQKQYQENPELKIGCIIPELNLLQDSIREEFQAVFRGSNILNWQPEAALPFNLSGGQCLGDHPMIRSAIASLQLNPSSMELDLLSDWLLSPYWNKNEEEASFAAELDYQLREFTIGRQINRFYFNSILESVSEIYPHSEFPLRWAQPEKADEALSESKSSKKKSHEQWVQYFKQQLEQIGWPGHRGLNAEERQVWVRWQSLLAEYSTLAAILPEASKTEAVATLIQLTKETLFQAQSESGPIQILGILETAGLEFDRLWVMGLTDSNWPPSARPNPFIPIQYQRAWKLPHASSERELAYTETIHQRLLHSASEIIFSTTLQNQGLALSPSPLIKNLPATSIENLNLDFKLSQSQMLLESSKLESLEDFRAPVLDENENIKGGSYILKEQALCPFRAFANLRLNTKSISTPELGLSALTKGQLIHKVLELIWKELKTQEALKKLSEVELNEFLNQMIHRCIKPLENNPALKPFLKIERIRIHQLLKKWLNLEKFRDPFEVIAVEVKSSITIGKLNLNLRIDRIDRLENGSTMIIDYKTGASIISDWFGSRPLEPQLPLYTTFSFTEAECISFAEIKMSSLKFKGLSAQYSSISGITPLEKLRQESSFENWKELQSVWRENLSQLAQDFYNGYAAVDPIDINKACGRCGFQGLCRINSDCV